MSDWKLKKGPFSITALERLWLAADFTTIVRDGDPRAASLLAAPGTDIPPKLARRLGLFDEPKDKPSVTKEKLSLKGETAAPEDIEARSTRPAEPPKKR